MTYEAEEPAMTPPNKLAPLGGARSLGKAKVPGAGRKLYGVPV